MSGIFGNYVLFNWVYGAGGAATMAGELGGQADVKPELVR
jgi:hypothetical protein